MKGVVLVDSDPGWPAAFERIRDRVRDAVAELADAIEHVGSTAVPGMPAKAVIDVDVVAAPERIADCVAALESAGWRHRGDLGVPGREAFHGPDDLPPHHLYLCVRDGTALRNHLAVRDALRADPGLAARYGDLKRRAAREHGADRAAYGRAKTDFLTELLRGAGFSEGELDAVAAANRPPTSASTDPTPTPAP